MKNGISKEQNRSNICRADHLLISITYFERERERERDIHKMEPVNLRIS